MQAALLKANGGALTSEMLNPLSRAVPEPKEAADIRLYLKVCLFMHLLPRLQPCVVLYTLHIQLLSAEPLSYCRRLFFVCSIFDLLRCLNVQGEHLEHKGMSDPQQLAIVERYFAEVMDIPQLQARLQCFLFTRHFASNAQRVCLTGSTLHIAHCNKMFQDAQHIT